MMDLMNRTLVVGDIHGKFDLLKQAMKRAKVTANDKLIFLGDYVDGGGDDFNVVELLDYLINLKNDKVLLNGNHDQWCFEWLMGDKVQPLWIQQGGKQTVQNFYLAFNEPKYINPYVVPISEILPIKEREKYLKFFIQLLTKYEDDEAYYIHGGFGHPFESFETVTNENAIWDRDLITSGWKTYKGKTVFLGHSCVQMFENTDKPLIRGQVIDLDTGAGHGKKLTIMDRDTKEYWQSDESGFGRH